MTASIVSSKAKWKEFFARYYKREIQQLAVSDQKIKALEVDFGEILKFDKFLCDELLVNPGKVLKDAEDAIPLIELPVKKKILAHVRFIKLPKKTKIRDIRDNHIGKLVTISCTVRNITEVKRRIIISAHECARCGNIQYMPQSGRGRYLEPSHCECDKEKKGVFTLLTKMSTFENYQRIMIQESLEDLDGGSQPQSIECDLAKDQLGLLNPGDHIVLNGILKDEQKINKNGKTTEFESYISVIGFERDREELEELEISPADEEEIKKLAARKDVFTAITWSIAPSVNGHAHIKLAIGIQMFGSDAVYNPDGTRVRGDVHILWMGDPGVAKSQVLSWVAENAPRAISTVGGNATGPGLVAATVKDGFNDETFSLQAGAMALASNNGICIIDEIDKIRKDDREKIHPAMEGKQQVPIDRAGFHSLVTTRCSVLAAGNPKLGRFNKDDSISDQINLPPTIMDRFDFKFVSYDDPDEKRDLEISSQILDADMGKAKALKPEVDSLLLKKWVAYGKRHCSPKLTEESRNMIQEYYLGLRKASANSTIKIAARSLNSLTRISKAAARMTLSPTVEPRHVEVAIELMDRSVKDTCTDENGNIDIDTITAGVGKVQRERIVDILNIIRAQCGKNKVPVKMDDVIAECTARHMDETSVRKEITRLITIGEIWAAEDDKVALP